MKPPCFGVLITYLKITEEILSLCQQLGACKVQLHGDVSLDELINLRKIDQKLFIIKKPYRKR